MDSVLGLGLIQAREVLGISLDVLVFGLVLGVFIFFMAWGARPSVIERYRAPDRPRESEGPESGADERQP